MAVEEGEISPVCETPLVVALGFVVSVTFDTFLPCVLFGHLGMQSPVLTGKRRGYVGIAAS